jgi:hypothetical protein
MIAVPATKQHARDLGITDIKAGRAVAVVDNGVTMGFFHIALMPRAWWLSFRLAPMIDRASMTMSAKKAFFVGTKTILSIAKQARIPVLAEADPTIARSGEYLRHFGFECIVDRIYERGPDG